MRWSILPSIRSRADAIPPSVAATFVTIGNRKRAKIPALRSNAVKYRFAARRAPRGPAETLRGDAS